ncbi:melanocortin receptor 4-like [Oculina patagonica]
MVSQLCSLKLNEYITLVHFYGTFMLVSCVLNLTFSVVGALGNLLAIRALWKASSLSATLKNLFLSLAVSDLAVASIPQFMLGVNIALILQKEASESNNFDIFCPKVLTTYLFFFFFLASASFLTITAIAVDRFLAISLHLRYQELVTPKRVIIALLGLWLTSAIAASIFISIPNHNLMVVVIIELYGLFVTTVVYSRIYRVSRHHQNQILSQCQLHNNQAMVVLREKKSAINALFVYVFFIACYVPSLCCAILMLANTSGMSIMVANHVTVSLVLLNSSLNPFLYCWRYREIRQIVKSTVKKILRITDTA